MLTATGFFCEACLVGKPMDVISPDPRYCISCCDSLTKEVEHLPKSQHPKWMPKIRHQKTIPLPQHTVLIMSTPAIYPILSDTKDIITPQKAKIAFTKKRGPKHRLLPEDLIKRLAQKGFTSKKISAELFLKYNITISYKTIQRILSGQRELPL